MSVNDDWQVLNRTVSTLDSVVVTIDVGAEQLGLMSALLATDSVTMGVFQVVFQGSVPILVENGLAHPPGSSCLV
jgi:hypothetical protein